MIRYVAFLRGINVGGHNVQMEQLRKSFEALGFNNVKSYISSGNIFFESDNLNREELTSAIEIHLHKALGYEVPTFLRTIAELESIFALNPFKTVELTADKRFCVIFTNELIDIKNTLPIHSSKNDMDILATGSHELFVVWHIINGRPPSGKFATGTIPQANTTRFYHTLIKILQAAKAY